VEANAKPDPIATFLEANPKSRALYEQAVNLLPGGTTRTTVYYSPFPPYMARGEGCYVYDVDGNRRIDFLNNYTSLILGHAHPAVVAAVNAQMALGSAFAAPTLKEMRLAELISSRVKSVERLRFTNSGTEATMFAMRLARVFTGRTKVAKFEGGYHGTHDNALISVNPAVAAAGAEDRPTPVPDTPGIPIPHQQQVVVLPFNDRAATAAILREHKDELAGVIVEPIIGAGGIIAPRDGFLQFLREITQQYGIVLIFDEVISLRVSPGGAQELYGVTPDLTTMGKIVGGGFPVAAFGGRADIMDLMDTRRRDGVSMPQGGTFNGNPVGAAAGIATLEQLTPDVYSRLNEMGDEVRARLNSLFARKGEPVQAVGVGSLFNIHFTSAPIRNHRDVARSDKARLHRFFVSLVNHGVILAPRGMGALSTPMGEHEIAALEAAVLVALEESRG
jgi:glutamate-1-semialdehyde 2,1-aminomutase